MFRVMLTDQEAKSAKEKGIVFTRAVPGYDYKTVYEIRNCTFYTTEPRLTVLKAAGRQLRNREVV